MTSLMRIGVRRLLRSFLCTQRKLTSEVRMMFFRTRKLTGTADMKATRGFLVGRRQSRMPTCHSGDQPGDIRALGLIGKRSALVLLLAHARVSFPRPGSIDNLPFEDCSSVVEAEHGLIILDIVAVQQLVDLLDLVILCQIHGDPLEALDTKLGGLLGDIVDGLDL